MNNEAIKSIKNSIKKLKDPIEDVVKINSLMAVFMMIEANKNKLTDEVNVNFKKLKKIMHDKATELGVELRPEAKLTTGETITLIFGEEENE